MANKTYQVRVTNEFRAITSANRNVAGLSIATDGDGYLGDLNEEQLAELAKDKYVIVSEPKEDEATATKSRIKATTAARTRKAKNVEDAKAEAKAAVDREPKEIVAGTPGKE